MFLCLIQDQMLKFRHFRAFFFLAKIVTYAVLHQAIQLLSFWKSTVYQIEPFRGFQFMGREDKRITPLPASLYSLKKKKNITERGSDFEENITKRTVTLRRISPKERWPRGLKSPRISPKGPVSFRTKIPPRTSPKGAVSFRTKIPKNITKRGSVLQD